jgi:TRAP-type C4-dicarboxylate transport system substrate-binding protein
LANGQVDAIDMDLELIVKLRYYELSETVLLSNHMMFPMVGLISARVWSRLDAADQVMIRDLMRGELDELIDSYVAEERSFEASLRESGTKIIEVDRSFFGPTIQQWDNMWIGRAPVLGELRELGLALGRDVSEK